MNLRALKRTCPRSLGSAPSKRRLMSARLAMFSLLVCAFFVAGTGAALAVSGASGSGSAGKAQYLSPSTENRTGGGDGAPDSLEGDEDAPRGAVAGRQIESAGDAKLPFTGLAAVPLLLIGCGLLVAGVATRRRTSTANSS